MVTDVEIDPHLVEQVASDEPCGTLVHDCDERATWMIWVDHHVQGCGSYGYRCDWHFNLLILEAQRMLGRLRSGLWVNCGVCDQLLTSHTLSDYVRGIRL